MGVYYAEYLIPVPPHLGYIPTVRAADDIVAGLVRLEWVDPASSRVTVQTGRDRATMSFDEAKGRLIELLSAPAGVKVTLPSLPQERWWGRDVADARGKSRMYELEETDQFVPRYCESATLVVTPALAMVPADGRSVRCPRCGNPQFGSFDPYEVGLLLPKKCEKCGEELVPARLVATTHSPIDGVPKDELAPFFRFAIVLDPAPKAGPGAYPVRIDPELMDLCRRATGLEFRNIAQWG